MYLHLGRDISVPQNSIVTIFDMDTATHSRHTRAFLRTAERLGRIVVICDELPKSAVVCVEGGRQVVYISQISSQTLLKRSANVDRGFLGDVV